MSKNPPKPNTSPDHVKETAEAFTCPSHIEARERLGAALAVVRNYAISDNAMLRIGHTDLPLSVADLRALLATPTQGEDISSSPDHDPAIGSALEEAARKAGLVSAVPALGRTIEEMRQSPGLDELCRRGDTKLYWVNEGDIYALPSSAEQVAGRGPGMQNNTSATPTQGEPVAWAYELAHAIGPDGYTNWGPRQVTFYKPCVPEGSVRNLTPLYDTPTQEGVGREEIATKVARIIRWVYQHGAEWGGTKHDVTEPAIIHAKAEADILSLLPAPKLGEDHGATFDRFRDEALGCQRAQPQQPAPGAPEGWRERADAALKAMLGRKGPVASITCRRGRQEIIDELTPIFAALTSSSAKPVGEEDGKRWPTVPAVGELLGGLVSPADGDPPFFVSRYEPIILDESARVQPVFSGPSVTDYARLHAENEALAQSNRRLREAGQAVVDRWDTPLWKNVEPTAEVINQLRAALKDNGHEGAS